MGNDFATDAVNSITDPYGFIAMSHDPDIVSPPTSVQAQPAQPAQPITIAAKFDAPGIAITNTTPMFPTKFETPPPQPTVATTITPTPMAPMTPAKPPTPANDLMQQPSGGQQLDTTTMLAIGGGVILLVLLMRK